MPTYINLVNFTGQGIEHFRETTQRAQRYQAAIEQAGGRFREALWTMGPYDAVVIFDAPDDETASVLALLVARQGSVRTTTMRAFDADTMQRIIARAG